jgi:predicted 3-demethylubiquinone-9 3-methyltransferase (glyoxalase superfamily)
MKNQIFPCLWYDGKALEAANFYCSIFKNSTITFESPVVVIFELNGQKFMGLNGGPIFQFNEAVSFVVECEDQNEINYYWEKLTQGGAESRCGWLKDRYGVSWQIVPAMMGQLMSDPVKSARVMEAVMKMKKLDIATMLNA